MAAKQKLSRVLGMTIGLVVAGAGIVSVIVIDWRPEVVEESPPVRPLKTVVIGLPYTQKGGKFPGKVRAGRQVDLAFEVAGQLSEKLVKKGDEVEEGQLLARLDPHNYQNDLDAAKAELERAKAQLDRVGEAAAKNAVSKQELSNAEAAFNVAQAQVNKKVKALDDTYLRAKFNGVIADTFVENFQNITAKQSIMSLQDMSSIEIQVSVPEQTVALAKKDRARGRFVATFDYLPGREFEVEPKEFAMEADPKTQTYAATLSMIAPDDVNILPGMTATVTAYQKAEVAGNGAGFAAPLDAVPIDETGAYYVWIIDEARDGTATVHRTEVKVGKVTGDQIIVVENLSEGDRIAAAGVHLLREGQRVRPIKSAEGGAQQ